MNGLTIFKMIVLVIVIFTAPIFNIVQLSINRF